MRKTIIITIVLLNKSFQNKFLLQIQNATKMRMECCIFINNKNNNPFAVNSNFSNVLFGQKSNQPIKTCSRNVLTLNS